MLKETSLVHQLDRACLAFVQEHANHRIPNRTHTLARLGGLSLSLGMSQLTIVHRTPQMQLSHLEAATSRMLSMFGNPSVRITTSKEHDSAVHYYVDRSSGLVTVNGAALPDGDASDPTQKQLLSLRYSLATAALGNSAHPHILTPQGIERLTADVEAATASGIQYTPNLPDFSYRSVLCVPITEYGFPLTPVTHIRND